MKGKIVSLTDFEALTRPLLGLPLSHIWQGYGSAIFLEFGDLEKRRRRDGSDGNPIGEWTLGIEWSWRIEGKRRIWCGSWSEKERWARVCARLKGQRVASISLMGRLPEIDVQMGNGLHVVSFMTAEGDPEWGLISRCAGRTKSIGISAGRLTLRDETRKTSRIDT